MGKARAEALLTIAFIETSLLGVVSNETLADQVVILGVGTDPKPKDAFRDIDAESPA
jgi:hypothetical protein